MKITRFLFLALLFTTLFFSQVAFIEEPVPISEGSKTVGLRDVPVVFRLFQNTPNPFNPVTKIRFALPVGIDYTLKIYDLLGNELDSYSGYKPAGVYEFEFNGSNLSSGIYFYSIETIEYREIRKMILVK